jgi:hypothetical protein
LKKPSFKKREYDCCHHFPVISSTKESQNHITEVKTESQEFHPGGSLSQECVCSSHGSHSSFQQSITLPRSPSTASLSSPLWKGHIRLPWALGIHFFFMCSSHRHNNYVCFFSC